MVPIISELAFIDEKQQHYIKGQYSSLLTIVAVDYNVMRLKNLLYKCNQQIFFMKAKVINKFMKKWNKYCGKNLLHKTEKI